MSGATGDKRTCWNCGDEIPAVAETCDTCGVAQRKEGAAPAGGKDQPLEIGDVLAARYEIRGTTSEGALGAVYKVHDREIDVSLALKTIRSDVAPTEEVRKEIRKAIKKARRFLHKNVVKIYESGEEEGHLFFTMEFLGGIHLRKLLQARSDANQYFSLEEAAPILEQVALAVDEAHKQGLFHGNIKPENIVIEPQGLKVTEFGLVSFLEPTKLYELQKSLGTESYTAPELAKGTPLSAASDVYSIGAILYEMLTNQAPAANPPLPSEINAAVPREIDDLLQRALDADPAKRPASVGEIYRTVGKVLGGEEAEPAEEVAEEKPAAKKPPEEKPAPPPKAEEPAPPPAPPKEAEAADEAETIEEPEEAEPEPETIEEEKVAPPPPPQPPPPAAKEPPPPAASAPPPPPEQPEVHHGTVESMRPEPKKPAGPVSFPGEQTLQEAIEKEKPRKKEKKPKPAAPPPAAPSPAPPPPPQAAPAPAAAEPQKGGAGGLIAAAVVVLALAGGGGYFYFSKQGGESAAPVAEKAAEAPAAEPTTKPTTQPTTRPAPKPVAAQPKPEPKPQPQATPAPPPKPVASAPSGPTPEELERQRQAEETRRVELARQQAEEQARREAEQQKAQEARKAAAAAASSRCPGGMVEIKGGEFPMGSAANDSARDAWEKPLTPVTVKSYCIDQYEFPGKQGEVPRAAVSWEQARALCSARKKRLCSEEEWEKACKGSSHARYPYGNQYNPNVCSTKGPDGQSRPLAASGSFAECKSDYGVYDLSGNLKEWTSSNWSDVVQDKVVRGGSFSRPDWATRCAFRENVRADQTEDQIGFRCCTDL